MGHDNSENGIIFKSAVVAMIVGAVIAADLVWLSFQETYSSLYLYPDSYQNYVNSSQLPTEVFFTYGIKSYELESKVFKVNIFLGDRLVKTKEVKLNPGETFEEQESVIVPENTEFPVKVTITTETDREKYEVHFWLKELPR